MSNQNDVIDVTVRIGEAPVGRAGFGVAICADAGGSMSERIRYYGASADVSADELSGAITAAQATHLRAALSQRKKPARVGAAKIAYAVAQVSTATVGGTIGDGFVYTLTVNGVDYVKTAVVPTDDNDAVATELRGLINADSSAAVVASGAGAAVVLTAKVRGVAFTVVSGATGTGTLVTVATTANSSISTELDAVLAESALWYGLHLVSRAADDIIGAAVWAESNKRLHVAQTNDAAVLTATAGNLAAQLKALGYEYTHLRWHSDNAVPQAFALLADRLAYDLDAQNAPAWGAVRLAGIAADDAQVSATAKANARAQYVGTYLSMYGVACTDSDADATRMASGLFLDERIIADWLKARCEENLAAFLIRENTAGRNVPLTDRGIASLGAVVSGTLEQAVTIAHLERVIDADTDLQVSPFLVLPSRASLTSGQVAARSVPISGGGLLSGSTARVTVVLDLTSDLDLLAQLAAA